MNQLERMKTLAAEALGYFEARQGNNGGICLIVRADAPAWLKDRSDGTSLIYAVHDNGEILPDEWRYRFTYASLEIIAYATNERDIEEPNLEPPIYTSHRLEWLGSHARRTEYVNDAVRDYAMEIDLNSFDIADIIGYGYVCEWRKVYLVVRDFLRDLADEMEDSVL